MDAAILPGETVRQYNDDSATVATSDGVPVAYTLSYTYRFRIEER